MTCSVCGGPIRSKRNISGICNGTGECKRQARLAAVKRWREAHPEKVTEAWAAYSPGYKQRRAALDAQRREDPEFRARMLATVQAFKTDPRTAERVKGYNRRGRQAYMARADRPCSWPEGCAEHAQVGSKYCRPHHNASELQRYHRTAAERKQAMAERQGWLCPLCEDYLPPGLGRTHVDHVIPRAVLPIEEDWNLQLAHARCNQEKSDRVTPQAIELAAAHGLGLAT